MAPRPYTLIAELTYRCPLRCPYCSNPVELAKHRDELTTEDWIRVLDEATELGVVQLHLSGGEPLARRDLETLVAHAREKQLFVNLVTSGVPLDRARFSALVEAGVDHVQVSFQDADPASSDTLAGYRSFDAKLDLARWVKQAGLPLTVNVVLHRLNLDRVAEIIALAESLSADRLELANTQYGGWALPNREALLPSREQIERGAALAAAAKERLRGRMDVLYVKPDYFGVYPKACMDGWARRFVLVTPGGLALPCHAAHELPLSFANVRDRSLGWIWRESPAFERFRGDAWMPDPCRSCDRKDVDFGGCRCQAFALTGDMSATDPACSLAPAHDLIVRAHADSAAKAERRYVHRGSR
jgi:pyrroloquinoline quinone biosynthesis protein E